jgi:arylformamidase
MTRDASSGGRYHDLTRALHAGMPVYPGDPPCTLAWASRVERDGVNVAALGFGSHTGTHVDAPYHLREDGARVGALPLDLFMGPTLLLDARGTDVIDSHWLKPRLTPGCTRLLLRTGAWGVDDSFPTHWIPLSEDAAVLLVRSGIRLLGTDAPSPDAAGSNDLPVHRTLLEDDIAIVENLLLDEAPEGVHQLIAFPLRLAEADASPLRAVLVER